MAKTLTLSEDLAAELEARVAKGAASSTEDLVRAGLQALDAEDARRLEAVRAKLKQAIDDPRPSLPAKEVFERVHMMIDALERK